MKEYKLSDRTVRIYDQHEALVAAGSTEQDDLFEQDAAIEGFFGECKVAHLFYNAATYNEDLELTIKSGVDVIIVVKE